MNAQAEEVAELEAADFATVSKILRSIERQERVSLDTFANWKLAFFMWNPLDVRYAMCKSRKQFETIHRAVLTNLLALTERLAKSVGQISEVDLERIGMTHQFFEIALKNIR